MTLRETFEQAPELYDRVRPGYPEELFDDLASLAGLHSGSRVLELGCGTGQATLALARRGYEIAAVELGAGLAQIARRKLAPFPAVRVVNAVFEDWPLPADPFDAVLAATSPGHRALEPEAQRGLLSCIVRLTDEHHGGRIAKRYMNELAVAYASSTTSSGETSSRSPR